MSSSPGHMPSNYNPHMPITRPKYYQGHINVTLYFGLKMFSGRGLRPRLGLGKQEPTCELNINFAYVADCLSQIILTVLTILTLSNVLFMLSPCILCILLVVNSNSLTICNFWQCILYIPCRITIVTPYDLISQKLLID